MFNAISLFLRLLYFCRVAAYFCRAGTYLCSGGTYVCRAATDGVIQLQAALGLPVAFGVITTDTAEQARARAAAPGSSGPNKGAEAAEVAVEMANLLSALRGGN